VSYGLHAECRVPLAYRKAGPTRGVMLTYVVCRIDPSTGTYMYAIM